MKHAIALLSCVCLAACGQDTRPGELPDGLTVRGDTTFISGPPSCAGCRIVLEPLVTLGDSLDPVTPDMGGLVVRTGDGRFLVSGLLGTHGIGEYDATGRFVRIHGRSGTGPGEYRRPPQLIVPIRGDTFVVYDSPLRRFSILSSDGTFVTSFQSPIRVSDFTAAPDGTILVGGTADLSGGAELGQAAHFLGRDGSILRSIGNPVGPIPENPLIRSRSVAVSPSGIIAVTKRLAYEIEIFFPDGSTKVLSRQVPWFTPTTAVVYPASMVTHTWLDDANRLWTSVLVPNPEATEDEIYSDDPAVSLKTRDFVVEVFELASGRLLASSRFTGSMVVHEGLATSPVVQPDGNFLRRVWIPKLMQSR